jgi:type IV pilus assembly protein PilY1
MKHMHRLVLTLSAIAFSWSLPRHAAAQSYTENFTGTTTTNSWYFINGACLTMGTSATTSPANPACQGLPYYSAAPQPLFGGDTGVLPDTTSGALRFTDWFAETGAILSNFGFTLTGPGAQGLQVSFTTVTYEGNSGGTGHDGADGMSFFLQDATYPADVGAFGGSLAYTCSNVNYNGTLRSTGIPYGYDGLQGGFIGLGIDEFGNFLNQGDNTSTGWNYVPGRIGMRGPGSTTWAWLNANYPTQYPSTLTTAQGAAAVKHTCRTGYVWDYSNPAAPVETAIQLPNYPAIGYSLVPTGNPIANESATTRAQAVPITYNLKVTPTGLLSLQYSYNGGAFQNVITNQDITQGGTLPIPANVRFGFAGSTGGSRNIHEIMCFQATPANVSASSAGVNQKQTAKVQTSQYLGPPVGDTNPNDLIISSTINWDGSCTLTGVPSGQVCDNTGPAGPISAQGPTQRVLMTWNGSTGIPFEWASLSTTWPSSTLNEQANLDTGDSSSATPPPYNYSRLDYLRGDRSNEQTPTSSTTYVGVFRDRASVLGDIIDSSPTWVGPPSASFPNTWVDKFNATGDTFAENSGQTYANYVSTLQTRTNVVYAGANDGFLHGFRSGYYSAPNTYSAASNDGWEVMAYMPGYVANTIQSSSAANNYSDPQYGHHYDVDAPPGTGDLYYGGLWHTWLVGGLGPGGNAIYALDITNPGMAGGNNFTEGSASTVVMGEWSNLNGVTNLTCVGDSGTPCGNNLGQTYGVPQIRRFHSGSWGAVFGNGYQSASGDGGIYVMLVDPTSGATSFYYLSTGSGSPGAPNGIFYTAAADLDGDHITDYIYAGDLLGHVWKFDVTSTNPANWGVTNAAGSSTVSGGGSPAPIFTTASTLNSAGAMVPQPITTQVVVASIAGSVIPRILIEFGTGQATPMTNYSAGTYATSPQALYGVWDWSLGSWNAVSPVQYTSLPSGSVAAPSTPLSGTGKLVQQVIGGPYPSTVPGTGTDYRTLTSLPVCYADQSGCNQYGWYINLVSGNAYAPDPAVPQTGNASYANTPVVYEQITYNPTLLSGAFIVNTTIPPGAAAIMCYAAGASGWTMAFNPATGGAFTQSFFGTPTSHTYLNVTQTQTSGGTTQTTTLPVSGIAWGGTGSVSMVQAGTQSYIVSQLQNGTGGIDAVNPPGATKGSRLTWVERR